MRAAFDAVAGRVTMYRLVLIVLVVLAAVSVVFAAVGVLGYGWLTLIVWVAVALVATVASSWLVARAFRARAHLESAAITALLLYFVLPPAFSPSAFGALALAGAVASASKFLIAWRGRHILNPAAAGALLVTATGLTFSGWWIGTATMLPFAAVGALVVLYRTRRLALGGTFLVVAALTEVVRALGTGSDIGQQLQFAFVSYPLVFFAGFMLSEPLTLPPRRWQQLVVAAVAGVLIAAPYHLGPVYASPQLALVVANVVAFAFGQRRGVRLVLESSRALSPSTTEFSFRPIRPVRFRPGQYLELDLPHRGVDVRGRRRTFSISSAPSADAPITIAMTMGERRSSFKSALAALEPGSTVHATGVSGDFTLPAPSVPVLLVAGGIGITPFASQLAEAVRRDAVVVYTASSAQLPYLEVLESSGARVVVVAPEAPDVLPRGWVYAGPERLSRDVIARHVPDAASRRAFVSGPPSLVSDARRMLRSLGVRRITTDYFTGY